MIGERLTALPSKGHDGWDWAQAERVHWQTMLTYGAWTMSGTGPNSL